MRIKTLSIEGIGSFLEKQSIDFKQYDQDGLFIIVGETGSGKSTILDAITFALYGITARWSDSGATKENQAIRSHFAKGPEKSEVVLEFELGSRIFRVTRSPKYVREDTKKSVEERISVEEIFADGSEITLANQRNIAGELITGLLRMSATEFLQVILLAQGRFDKFLDADSKERMALLSKIFYTSRFKQLENRLKDKKDAIQAELNTSKTKFETTVNALINLIGGEPPQTGQEISWVELINDEYEGALRSTTISAEHDRKKMEEARELKQTAERQKALHQIKAELADLSAESKKIAALRQQLESAIRANKITATYENRERLSGEVALLAKHLDVVMISANSLGIDLSKKGQESALERLISNLNDLAIQEKKVPKLQKDAEALEAKIGSHSEKLSSLREELKQAQKLVEELEAQEDEVANAHELIRQNQPILDKAESLAECEKDLAEAKANALSLDTANGKAVRDLSAALKAYNEDLAGTLAKSLNDGEPCMVCGSTQHPNPRKVNSAKKISKSIELYQSLAIKAASDLEANATLVKNLSAQVKKLKTSIEDKNIKEMRKEFQLAQKLTSDWKTLAPKLKALRAVTKPDSKTNLEIEILSDSKPKLQSDLDGFKTEMRSIESSIEKSLSGFKSISERITAEEEKLKILREFLQAKNDLGNATQTLKEFESSVKSLLASEGFSTESAYLKSVLDQSSFKATQSKVKEYDDDVLRLTSLQAQEIYQNLPTKVIDLPLAIKQFMDAEQNSRNSAELLVELRTKSNAVKAAQTELTRLAPYMMNLVEQVQVYEELHNTVTGKSPNTMNMSLETFVLAAELETVVEAANAHLKKLSNEQYSFQHTDKSIRRASAATGLELEIMDERTGRSRPTHGLSGGEEFLASISLAIGLAEVVTNRSGGISIDTLFIDEGFGSLSSDFLARAIDTLNSLRQGGRTIGVISHVDLMKEAIQDQIQVFKEPGGTSRVTQIT